ncbi:phage tail protein [Acidovorax sp. Leaf76]|jgi:microcystin-dependent protein|uniref:phage tail protein n=1 Tax=unclassified Acidovorax TaxID=2684926 RepID=UPI0006F8CE6E|nr:MULTISPECIES: tail fiber protein [unclassified Acidovorax]KQO26756.1 phage tail protein [Acidovorax sp. Leaf76]KQO40525.1 phage tail protein [Acidovorax sp. Leaf84]KQS42668.1 phage tail protein [Acidovorax sp. Leaf191]
MATPYLGEIRLLPYEWPPKGWMLCQGQTLAISTNQALFTLLGVTYGGNGTTNFQLPDLRGRSVRHAAQATPYGSLGGSETVSLVASEMPAHIHAVMASAGNANSAEFTGALVGSAVAGGNPVNLYADASSPVQALAPGCVSTEGAGQPHDNCQPSLVLNYCIAVTGVFPSRN